MDTPPPVLLDPPVTSRGPDYPLKPDNNYDWFISDAEVDSRARMGHGWVRPLPDGRVAKCGGPTTCGVCRREHEIFGDASDERPTDD